MNGREIAQRKALLLSQADLQRLRLAHEWQTIKDTIAPRPSPERSLWARPKMTAFLNVALPLVGARRLARVVRVLSLGLMAFRALRGWGPR